MLVHREKWIGEQEQQQIISELVFPEGQNGMTRLPASTKSTWKQEVGFYGSVKLGEQNIAYFC